MHRRQPPKHPSPGRGPSRTRLASLVALFAVAIGGCSGTGDSPASLMTASLAASAGSGAFSAPPTEVYSRIARGALKCWFGRSGSLKGTHVFHADADSPVKGGAAEIVVFERDAANPNPRGLRALRIVIAPVGEGTHVGVEILRVPGAPGARMREDVIRWGGGSTACGDPITIGWTAEAAPPAVVAKPQPTRKMKRAPRS